MRVRNKQIILRLTEAEYIYVLKKLNMGKKVFGNYSNYFLAILEKSEITINQIKTNDIVKELRHIGNNINQWTKGINIFNEVSKEDVIKLQDEITKMKEIINELTYKVNIKKT